MSSKHFKMIPVTNYTRFYDQNIDKVGVFIPKRVILNVETHTDQVKGELA